jgi:hypothetical protein
MRQALTSRAVRALALAGVLLMTAPVLALGRHGLNVSAGAAFSGELEGGKGAGGAGVEVSLHPVTSTWLSAGMSSGGGAPRAYLEAGAWFFGAGWARELGGSGSWATGFVGVPWPLTGVGEGEPWWGVYVEPYWRPAYRLGGEGARWRHEAGVLLKVTTVKIGSWAEPPR